MAETRTIRTVLELNAQRFNAGAASAAASAKKLSGELASITDASGAQRADYDRVANSLLGIGAAAATGLGLATKAAVDWETSWTGVLKTVDGTPAQLQAVEDGLRGLARELPASHTEIAAVAEAAGQLGVETGSVVEFTETMIALGVSTNLSAEEAATGLARFSNIMGTAQTDVDRLGSTIVGLGNSFATTEGEILAMGMRLAGTGNQVGLTEGDVFGLATAMSSLGIEAEAGGTAASMGLRKIQSAVDEGGESLQGFAEVAGMSADEFSRLWSEDPSAGLEAFVQGLARVGEEGGNVASVLDDLGIKGIRESDTFLRLAGDAEGLSDAMALANDEFGRNLALTEEATKFYQTTESQMAIARNALVDAGIDIGGHLLPVLADAAGQVATLAEAFSNLPGPAQEAIVTLGTAAAATGLVGGALLRAVPGAIDLWNGFKRLQRDSPATATAITRVGKAVGVATVAFGAASAVAAYGDSLNDVTIGAEEAAAAAMKLADGADPVATLFDGMYTGSQAASASTEQLAKDLDILANGHWYEGISNLSTNFQNAWGAGLDSTDDIRQRVEEIGQGLAGLSQTDLPDAQAGFTALMESFGGTEEVGLNLLELMPALDDAMAGLANEAGLDGTDAMTRLKLATGELESEMQGAEGASGEFGGAVSDATGEVEEQVDALEELQDRLEDTANLLLGVRGSERDFLDSLSESTAALKENGEVFTENGEMIDRHSEKARQSQDALDGIAESTHGWANAAEEAEASAEELAAIMTEGREAFIKMAEDMGMSEEAAIRLADELQLIPDFVETEVKVETEGAKQELSDLDGIMTEGAPVEVPVGADTTPAEGDVSEFSGLLSDQPMTVYVQGDLYGVEATMESFYATMMERDWTVDINGETVDAQEALDILLEEVNSGSGTVTINGATFPADTSLMALIEAINLSGGTVEIDGDPSGANAATDSAKRKADETTGTIDVDADTAGANSDINNAARDRDAVIRVTTVYNSRMAQGPGGAGGIPRASGGWLNEGLSGGGWVPGTYPGPGVDNVMWPMAGKAGGGMLSQPLAGTEYVVNGRSAQQWGPALEAINSGFTPTQMADLLGAARQPSGMAGRNITVNSNGYDPHQIAAFVSARLKHELTADDIKVGYHR